MLGRHQTPDQFQKQISGALDENESIQWIEQPLDSRFAAPRVITFLLTGISVTLLGVYLIFLAGGGPLPFPIEGIEYGDLRFALVVGIAYTLIGSIALLVPFWEWLTTYRVAYVVTDKRALVVEANWLKSTIKIYTPDRLKDLYLKERADGTGDVVITTRTCRTEGNSWVEEIGFANVRNPKETEKVLRRLAQSAVE
ncbi:hypothetical protein KR51_00024080 [Rubidibacter lacunae KORDI 51-2]|uniref:DUF304 domain-containing protein n=1 Tax=Rubidibacter lacunae KORDI 51-2 TaxID=582515 RepID=U5DKR2_9CHRO|nr:hypothetical protein KR51_00024080 [Rubidibacter lacunae KORDI 51-2]